ncbi:hypothetical protein PGT21_004713 [Puccinia graminis f. sp. tritici]|uniref:Uncharacterized protein n=1 Tax=Puccinia graminis f. sp. tritici TaxID=56615 RepID=A0A5B0N2U4_PUCGR|nr:hypothetical protein PGT21_004713 [Puccinia graminis f. sp. tritici]KAA1082299.1 hypothetical protein PGTUg99_032188 [Puccinia graminis f. sp. tritici]
MNSLLLKTILIFCLGICCISPSYAGLHAPIKACPQCAAPVSTFRYEQFCVCSARIKCMNEVPIGKRRCENLVPYWQKVQCTALTCKWKKEGPVPCLALHLGLCPENHGKH